MDLETKKHGFATRSEFIRNLLRKYFTEEVKFEEFEPVSLGHIKMELARTDKYSEDFIESVVKGLSKASPNSFN
ncbi:hypothetical protein HYW41_04680 [Candidatus Daviesbacteria bacterium]|nr:hypothetical protein [Candidatus Daviesbacteria bacterium]